jgi:hypothetical protein
VRINRQAIHLMEPKRCSEKPSHLSDPYQKAQKNADYIFRFAKQFSRNEPFILIFVHHPWLGGREHATNLDLFTNTYL